MACSSRLPTGCSIPTRTRTERPRTIWAISSSWDGSLARPCTRGFSSKSPSPTSFCTFIFIFSQNRRTYFFSSSRSAKLLSKFNYYNDLVFLDPELHRNMMILKHYDGNVEEDFSLNFTVTDIVFGAVEVRAPRSPRAFAVFVLTVCSNERSRSWCLAVATYR